MTDTIYDVGIIGGGPAGCSAALYAGRAGCTSVMFEKSSPGGQMGLTSFIENYPGIEKAEGFELATVMSKQAKAFGCVTKRESIVRIENGDIKKLVTSRGNEYFCKTVIIAGGAVPRKLGIPGEKEFAGRGVSYCATCDGMFFRGRTVAVAGGGDTAFEDALYLSNICEKVYIIHRRGSFRAARSTVARAEKAENIKFVMNSVVTEIKGSEGVTGVSLESTAGGTGSRLDVSAVFIAAGRVPDTEAYRGLLELDGSGYIIAGEDTHTSAAGIFAAGDIRTKSLRQIVTACADGAVAATEALRYIEG